jgi:hypothetical protein
MSYRNIHLSKNLVTMTSFMRLANEYFSKGKAIPVTDGKGP